MTTARITWQQGEATLTAQIERAFEASGTAPIPLQANARRTIELLSLDSPEARDVGEDPECAVVAKRYHRRPGVRGLRDAAKRAVGRSAGRREWTGLVTMAALGIPAPSPLALGETAQGEAILVTGFVPGRPLGEALADGTVEDGPRLASGLAESIQTLHASGHFHGDLHLGNLRYAEARVVILDPQRMRRSGRPGMAALDWAQLDASIQRAAARLRPNTAAATRLEDFRRALRQASRLGPDLDRARLAFDRDHQRGRARRRFRRDRDWRKVAWPPAFTGFAERGIDDAALRESFAAFRDDLAAESRRDGRVRIRQGSLGQLPAVVKRVDAGSFRRALADRFRGSAGARAFRRGQRAGLVGDSCARPLAYIEERRLGLPFASWS